MLLLFLTVSLISFVGSLHPGSVNVAVAQTTLSHNRRAGMWLALGGSLPEIAYSGLAVSGLSLLPANSGWAQWLPYAPVPVLLGAGIAAFFQKPVSAQTTLKETPSVGARPFWKGVVLAGVNPQLLPFWSAVWLYLAHTMWVPVGTLASRWVFALGASAGAFAFLWSVAWLADRQRHRVEAYVQSRKLHYVTGGLFIAMALGQAIHLLTRP